VRQLFNIRLWAALGVLSITALLIVFVACDDCFGRNGDSAAISADVEEKSGKVKIADLLKLSNQN